MDKDNWKDTVVKVLIGVLISNIGWFTVWAQDVATKSWVEEHAPILRTLPTLTTDISRINIHREKIESLERNDIRVNQTMTALINSTSELKQVVQELTKEVNALKLEIAKGKR